MSSLLHTAQRFGANIPQTAAMSQTCTLDGNLTHSTALSLFSAQSSNQFLEESLPLPFFPPLFHKINK